jgi:DNA repair protein RadC
MPVRTKRSGIANWPEDERPRERLLSRGPHTLTDAEIIAILLRVGVRGKSAVELARELLKRFGTVQAMMSAPITAWDGLKGLGKAKLAQLLAALELGRRASLPATREKTIIKSTQQATAYFAARLRNLPEEHFRVAYINRQGRLLEDSLIAQGTVDSVRPHIRTLVSRALQTNASAIIAAHNHPSGTPEPSEVDRLLTRDIIAACLAIGVKVLDHVVIADKESFSFADSGLLDELKLEILVTPTLKQ